MHYIREIEKLMGEMGERELFLLYRLALKLLNK